MILISHAKHESQFQVNGQIDLCQVPKFLSLLLWNQLAFANSEHSLCAYWFLFLYSGYWFRCIGCSSHKLVEKKFAYFNYVSTWTSLLNMMFASLTMCPLGLDFDKFLLLNMMNLNYDFECLHYYDYFGGVFPFETLACFLFFLIW